ncbi:hypothetical protein L4D09_28590, partial [Photobacterium makurazakiensis]|uniref:hypothetical protein n=1 Tax=Photobacterium makurazakiensis TaxID=2910234 RepID=UPI003D09E9CF
YKYTVEPDLDTLFNLLNSIHSLNDRLETSQNANFYDSEEFIALKALRNLFHHQEELLNRLLIIPFEKLPQLMTDMLYACLVPASLVELSIEGIPKKFKAKEEVTIRKVLHWYHDVVNINPCVFNFAVHIYEMLSSLGVELKSEEFLLFQDSYLDEQSHGHDHYIDGKIYVGAGSVSEILSIAYNRNCITKQSR